MNDLLDDLTLRQYHDLVTWLGTQGYAVTRANVRGWRRRNNLPVNCN